jgi:hypothetical protein
MSAEASYLGNQEKDATCKRKKERKKEIKERNKLLPLYNLR